MLFSKYPSDLSSLIHVEKFTCIKIKIKIVRRTRVLSSYNSLALSLCRCLAITPNLVVSSRLRLKRPVIHRKAAPAFNSPYRLLFPMYTNFRCSFGCITHIFHGCRKRRFATRYFPMSRRRVNAFAICICRTLTCTIGIVTVSDGHPESTSSLFH